MFTNTFFNWPYNARTLSEVPGKKKARTNAPEFGQPGTFDKAV